MEAKCTILVIFRDVRLPGFFDFKKKCTFAPFHSVIIECVGDGDLYCFYVCTCISQRQNDLIEKVNYVLQHTAVQCFTNTFTKLGFQWNKNSVRSGNFALIICPMSVFSSRNGQKKRRKKRNGCVYRPGFITQERIEVWKNILIHKISQDFIWMLTIFRSQVRPTHTFMVWIFFFDGWKCRTYSHCIPGNYFYKSFEFQD